MSNEQSKEPDISQEQLNRMFARGEEHFWAKRGIKIKNSWRNYNCTPPKAENLPDERAKQNQ